MYAITDVSSVACLVDSDNGKCLIFHDCAPLNG